MVSPSSIPSWKPLQRLQTCHVILGLKPESCRRLQITMFNYQLDKVFVLPSHYFYMLTLKQYFPSDMSSVMLVISTVYVNQSFNLSCTGLFLNRANDSTLADHRLQILNSKHHINNATRVFEELSTFPLSFTGSPPLFIFLSKFLPS